MGTSNGSRIKVDVRDVMPGTYYEGWATLDGESPSLDWSIYEATFRLLWADPDLAYRDWPFRKPFEKACRVRFGKVPDEHSSIEEGRSWAPDVAERTIRALASELGPGRSFESRPRSQPMQVKIAPDGRVCVVEGNKRTAILRTISPPVEVDYEVVERSPGWLKIREILEAIAGARPKCLYQPLEHPDFSDWAVTQPSTDRVTMINGFLARPGRSGSFPVAPSLVDFGCNTGFFTRHYNRLGWQATGIDINPSGELEVARVMETWRDEHRTGVRYMEGDIAEIDLPKADVGLLLSVIMHTFGQRGASGGWDVIRRVSEAVDVLFVDCVWGGYSSLIPFRPEDMGPAICAKTSFERFEKLGVAMNGSRPFYVFCK